MIKLSDTPRSLNTLHPEEPAFMGPPKNIPRYSLSPWGQVLAVNPYSHILWDDETLSCLQEKMMNLSEVEVQQVLNEYPIKNQNQQNNSNEEINMNILKCVQATYAHKPTVNTTTKWGSKQVVCKLGCDMNGVIKYVGSNARAIFGFSGLVEVCFWDLMANYNRVYFQTKFGDNPFIGMSKRKNTHILRFSLKHLDEDFKPAIITCKIIFIKDPVTTPEGAKIKWVKILARRSSDESTNDFREKIKEGTLSAGLEAINRIRQEEVRKRLFLECMRPNYEDDRGCRISSPMTSGSFERNLHF